jgi:putative transposase
MAAEGHSIERWCRILGVSVSGFHAWRNRPPSPREIRHVRLTDLITKIHVDSRGVYGARRVHAELTLAMNVAVGHGAVELLMRRAGIQGLTGRPRFRKVHNVATSSDLVTRDFGRSQADELWVTDITEHPTREGKVYCCVVLDAWSRRVVGLHPSGGRLGAVAVDGIGRRLLGQRHDRVVLEPDAGRALEPQALEHPGRAGHRDVRVPRGVPQPPTPALRAWHAVTGRVRSSTSTTTDDSSLRVQLRDSTEPGTPHS